MHRERSSSLDTQKRGLMLRCLRRKDALCRGTIASIVLLLAQCIGGDDGAGQAVCRAGDMRAECGMTLVVHQPGKSLLPFVADEVKMRKRELDMLRRV